jgi:glycosyltransferase EpsF
MNLFSTNRLACSELAGDYFFGKNHYTLLMNGIDISKYARDCEKKETGLKFCTVGRLAPQKNPIMLLEIFRELHIIYPSSTLVWLGDGELKTDIIERIKKYQINSCVEMVGNTPNVAKYLSNSDYFLLPSIYEGSPLALIEAQASGLDCFISNTVTELANCGKCLSIPLHDSPKQWAQTISKYIEGSGKMELDNDHLSEFDIREMAHKLELIYKGEYI